MKTYLERSEKKVDDPYISIELINDLEILIAEGYQENIPCYKQILSELIDRTWHGELKAKKIGNWEKCQYYYRLSCQLRELLQKLEI